MKLLRLYAIIALAAVCLHAQIEPLPYSPAQQGYHDAELELAEYCLEQKLYSEARLLCEKISGAKAARAKEIITACEAKADEYTAQAWGGYLDRRETVMQRRAQGAHKAGQPAQQVLFIDPDHAEARAALGHKWLDGMGWLSAADHERFSKLVLKTPDAPEKPEREVSWEQPWVLSGTHFTLVTDLDFKRALKYAGLLERFHEIFFELLGDVIPQRKQPNLVWCCRHAATFVKFTEAMDFAMGETNAGMHVGSLGAVIINAERCDFVGRKNKAKDNLARTLYHECAHRLVESGLRGRRGGWGSFELAGSKEHAWIVESIAVVFEDLQITGSKHKLKGLEAQRTYTIQKHWAGEKGKVPALQPVLAQGFSAFAEGTPIPATEKYALAGTVAWYCLFQKPDAYRRPYLELLVDYYRLDTGRRDFEQRFGVSLKDFEAEWSAWVVKLK
jgi:hypothetical protein